MKKGRIGLFAIILFIMIQLSAFAAFKRAEPVTIETDDGTRIEAFITGDEYVQILHDGDGYVLVKAESGDYAYAKLEDGILVPCGDEKGIKYDEIGEEYFIKKREKIFAEMEKEGLVVPDSAPKLFSATDAVTEFKGSGTVVVVPIAFSGGSRDFAGFTQSVENACEYFKEVSYGELKLGFYDVSEDSEIFVSEQPEEYYHPYSDTNPDGYSDSNRMSREKALVAAAIRHYGLSAKRIDEPLDVNGDGNNDFLVFVYNAEIESAWNTLLWPHQIEYSATQFNILGKNVKRWIFIPRAERSETLSHEMYHAIGAPDLYGYTDQANYLGMWDIMDIGNGTMLSYMKYRYGGWIDEIPEITEPGTYTLNPVHEKENTCYKIPINDREYYVVEYRNRYSGRINCLDRWRQWHNEGLIIARVDKTRQGEGNMEGYEKGTEIRLVTHPVLGANSILGAILPEFSPESGFDRSLASGGTDDRTVIRNIRENADGTLSFDLSFDGVTTQKYEESQDVVIRSTGLRDSAGNTYIKLAPCRIVQNSNGSYAYQETSGVYNIKYLYLKGRESSANAYEYTDYTSPIALSSAGLIWAYMTDSDGTRVGEMHCSNIGNVIQQLNTARQIREAEYSTEIWSDPSRYKLSSMSFEGGDRYTGKLNMDDIISFNVDGVEYEFLSEDIRGQSLVFAADTVEVAAGDGSEVYMNSLAYMDYAEDCKLLFDTTSGRGSLFELAETVTGSDTVSMSALGSFAGEIRYTLDGTEPTATSELYKEPICVSEDTVVSAGTFLNGKRIKWDSLNVYVQDDYRVYSADELVSIFKNSGSSFAGGDGKYVKICYTEGEGTLILRNSDWIQVAKIVNPEDSGVLYLDAENEIFVQEASGDIFAVSVVDEDYGVDLTVLKNADGSGKAAVHSFDTAGDFELITAEFSGDRFVGATSGAVTLSADDTKYRPFGASGSMIKAFCFESLVKPEPKGRPASK